MGVGNIGWLVPLAAFRDGREVWRIGFDQQSGQRNVPNRRADIVSTLEGNDAAEGKIEAYIQRPFGQPASTAETMPPNLQSGVEQLFDEKPIDKNR